MTSTPKPTVQFELEADYFGLPLKFSVTLRLEDGEYLDDDAPTWPGHYPENETWALDSVKLVSVDQHYLSRTRLSTDWSQLEIPAAQAGAWAEENSNLIEDWLAEA